MKKSKLKNGDKVVHRNGEIYIKIGKYLCRPNGFNQLTGFDDNLFSTDENTDWDILKVYRPQYKSFILDPIESLKNHALVFDRMGGF